MRKLFTLLFAAALMMICLTGCMSTLREDSLAAIADSYSSDNYLEAQQQEIEGLVAEYTEKINASSDKDEIGKLKDECIDRIKGIYTKETVERIKADAVQSLQLVRGKILPYQEARTLIANVKERMEGDDYDGLEAAVKELNEFTAGVSDTVTYESFNKSVPFSFEAAYSEQDGLPVITYRFSDDVKKCGVLDSSKKIFAISQASICQSSILNPTVKKMVSYSSFGFNDKVVVYCGEDSSRMYENAPHLSRCTVSGNTYQLVLCTNEQKEVLNGDSEVFINSDGEETKRDSGDEDPINYIIIMVWDPANPHKGSTLADRVTWAVIL